MITHQNPLSRNSTVSSMVGNAAVEFASSLQRKKKSSMDKLKAILGN